ncbi:MAG TPA: MFS transporter [Thermosynechococcaceae cyanobacterium]
MNPLLVWTMAIASGATVANLYYNQPLLVVIGQSFRASSHEVGFIPMLTQVGYAVGILLFVPLGDLVERRKLITIMTSSTAGVMVLAALSPSLIWLVIASFAIGMTSVAAQILVPFAAHLAPPQERGKVVGTVMSGLLIGILSARTVSGFVGAALGWQAVYWLGSGAMVVLAVVLSKSLPQSQPTLKISYDRLMVSLGRVGREQPVLWEAALIGALSFGAFSAFWSTLVFLLEQPPYRYGSEVAGLFGLVGIVGALAAPRVGKIADRRSHRFTVKLGILFSTLAFLVFWAFGLHLWGLILGVILLDLGVQTTQISNQAGIYSLPAEIHSRLNALYITVYFVGGAIGSYLGSYGWDHWGWNGVCGLSLLLLLTAFASFLCPKSID